MNVIKSRRLYFVEQCCAENGVPHNCLGLCVEDNVATLYQYPSFCDEYQVIVDRCATLPPPRKFHMQRHRSLFTSSIIILLCPICLNETKKYVYYIACNDDGFKCTNGYCISADQRCDGKDDCGDGSDEIGCPSKL